VNLSAKAPKTLWQAALLSSQQSPNPLAGFRERKERGRKGKEREKSEREGGEKRVRGRQFIVLEPPLIVFFGRQIKALFVCAQVANVCVIVK